MSSLTLEDIREAFRKLEPYRELPTLRGSPWVCPGNAYHFYFNDEHVIFVNDEELELLLEGGV